MIRLIPPVSVPVGAGRVATSVFGSDAHAAGFRADLESTLGFPRGVLFGSGRAALAAFLKAARSPGRDEVAIPAYTCWSVPASAVRAGLRVRLVDIDPVTFDPDLASLEAISPSTIACVILAHLFARSLDIAAIVPRLRELDPGMMIVEDAAQAWPAAPSSPADAVLLSFGRGKPLALGAGGALLHRAPLSVDAPPMRGGGWLHAGALALASLLGRPRWYRLPEALPFLGIGKTVYAPDFPTRTPFRNWQGALGRRLLPELPAMARARSEHARRVCAAVSLTSGWSLPAPAFGPGPIRLPILAPSRQARDRALVLMGRLGVRATALYPGTLADIPELRPHLVNPDEPLPGAKELSLRLLTVPVYPTLSAADVDRVAEALGRATREISR